MRWRSLPGFEKYLVSEQGHVWSLNRGSLLAYSHSGRKRYHYLSVELWRDNERHRRVVHKLVWLAFGGEIPDGHQVDHIDRDRFNNHIENLRCVTVDENIANKEIYAIPEEDLIPF